MTWVISLLLGVVVILAITAVTGYFVAQEFAYMAVDRARLASRSESGDAGARRALGVTRRTSFMLSGAQLGITVTGLLVGYVAEPLVGEALGEALGGVGVPVGTGVAIGTVLALVFSTLVQMLFGELVPKNLAIARPEPVALWLARSTTIYLAVFGWLIKVFDAASNALLRLLRIEPVHDVEHAMIPRARVGVVHADDTLAQVRELMAAGHSRYPVVDDDGEVTGVVHLTDLLAAGPEATTVADLLRPALVLPTSMALPDALRELSATRNQMACVVDEYGGFAGVLTVEDLAEELVGEITDEHDDEIDPVTAASDGVWVMAGDVHLDEVERAVERDLPEGDHETIAGLAIAVHGSLPAAGDVVDVPLPIDPATLVAPEPPPAEVLRIEVLDVERHVPSHVRVTVVEAPPEEQAETPADHHAGTESEEAR
ncbi:hemolysin family protein [Promicromonospora sukumoe]|uniref:hemolysin family protein n=1 Tax=Promicromonospora sukumoe TaxID=88382 RepID=UPI00035EB93E|nr:hemolysin family protein [Promicromonospora sukumoe]